MSGQRPADFGRALVPVRRPNPAVIAWRWRWELGTAVAAVGSVLHYGPLWTILYGAFLAGALSTPYGRRWLWYVITPHRVRTGLAHAWVHSRTGRIPMVLRTRPVPLGEEILLLLRPGTTADDVRRAGLAADCWAREVRVEPDPVRAHLVRLIVVRRSSYDEPA